jgi:predicted dehydrogenase
MESRRSFLGKLVKSTAVSAVALGPSAFSGLFASAQNEKPVRIGIIGAENSHTIEFGKVFNVEKKFPEVEVLYVWGETEEFARNAMEKGGIPEMVKDPLEMMGKIDALIVDHRHGKYHLEAAAPFVKAGIPAFIDKPFCYRLTEGKEFLAMAEELGTPVTSFSSIAWSNATFDIRKHLESMDPVNQAVMYGPADIHSKYGGIFFYGPHSVQTLMVMFGEDIVKARITKNRTNASASLAYQNGMLATIIFTSLHYGWETFVETKDGIIQLKSGVEETDPSRYYQDIVEMFRTGKEPRSHASILKCVAILEALEKSSVSENWETVGI